LLSGVWVFFAAYNYVVPARRTAFGEWAMFFMTLCRHEIKPIA
jgi:hypothetical protein